MTPKERKVMELALEELAVRFSEGWHEGIKIDASDIMLLNKAAQALAQPAVTESHKQSTTCGEPVAWMVTSEMQDGTKNTYPLIGRFKDVKDVCDFGNPVPLYTAPPPVEEPHKRKPLTDGQIFGLDVKCYVELTTSEIIEFARAIEAAHGIKE